MTLLQIDDIPAMQDEVRALARERGAVILAHNYQRPEVQDVADFVGDSLGLSQRAAATAEDVIAFCGVHFMAETASILCPDKTVLLPDPDAGCSLADSIDAAQLRAWKAKHPGAVVVMYVNTTAEVKAETDYCVTSSNAVAVVEHIYREHGDDTEILFGPDMFLGAYVEKVTGPAHVRVGRRVPRPRRHPPARHRRDARRPPGRRLPHPPRVRLLHGGDGVRGGGRRRPARRPHALHGRDAGLRGGRRARADGDRGDGDGHAAPAAHGGPRRGLRGRQRGRELPLHEDDHARQPARLPARARRRWSRCPTRSRSARGCRSSAWSRSRRSAGGRSASELRIEGAWRGRFVARRRSYAEALSTLPR